MEQQAVCVWGGPQHSEKETPLALYAQVSECRYTAQCQHVTLAGQEAPGYREALEGQREP